MLEGRASLPCGWMAQALRRARLGVWRLDVTTQTLEWTEGIEEMFGVETFEGTVGAYLALLHPDDRARAQYELERCIRHGTPFTSEYRVAGLEPTRWIGGEAHPVRDEDGEVTAVVGTVGDISEQRRAELALEGLAEGDVDTDVDQRLDGLVENLATLLDADFAYVATTEGDAPTQANATHAWADGRKAEPFGYGLDGAPCAEVLERELCVHPRDVQAQFPRDRLLVDMGVHAYAGAAIHDDEGRPLGLLVALWRRELTALSFARAILRILAVRAGNELWRARASAERETRAARARHQASALAELSRSDVWRGDDHEATRHAITELGARTLDVERVSIWRFDAERTEIELADLYSMSDDTHQDGTVLRRADIPSYFAAVDTDRALRADDARTDERLAELRDSYIVPHGIGAMLDAPIRLGGRQRGVLCVEHVGGPRHWNDDDVRFVTSLADFVSLARSLADRRDLEQQLRHAQKLESLGRLAGGIAHDFNNLLTAIQTGLELARTPLPDGSIDEPLLDEIADAGVRAAQLTKQLLTFARRTPVETKVLDVNDVVRSADRLLRRLIGEDVELETQLAEVGLVQADPSQLEQVLVNLAVNARDAMPNGGLLALETRSVDLDADSPERHADLAPGRYVMLSVSDTGSGMSSEVLAHVFEPFFTTKEQGRGTGLGLATCYGIVRQADGHIVVHSEPGRGTTFKVFLPVASQPDARSARHDDAQAEPRGTECVLLVEDDDNVRRMTQRGLSMFGYRVLMAGKPSEALELAARHRDDIDLVLSDVVMPERTGPELAQELRVILPSVPFVFMSGYAQSTMSRLGLVADSLDLVHKPFTPRTLALRIRRALDEAGP